MWILGLKGLRKYMTGDCISIETFLLGVYNLYIQGCLHCDTNRTGKWHRNVALHTYRLPMFARPWRTTVAQYGRLT